MKTKIVYISGNEVFDMADIRAAFEEVRVALNLDKETVLFGVPVDADDAGLMASEPETNAEEITIVADSEPEIKEESVEEVVTPIQDEIIDEPVVTEQPKKRTRKEKVKDVQSEQTAEDEEKIVPIMSILSVNAEDESTEPETQIITQEIEIVQKISEPESNLEAEPTEEEIPEETVEDIDEQEINDEDAEEEVDLEKLLSAMTPLQEDVLEDKKTSEPIPEPEYADDDISVDATLEQLATEFAENQDKIASSNKSSSRSKIGKLRNILPFKQSKHKDQGLGDLFGWAGVAANDEDFSVPGFFTNVASKK